MPNGNNVQIQGLEFEIVNDSKDAVDGLKQLNQTLNALKTATGNATTSLSGTAKSLSDMSNALKGLNGWGMGLKVRAVSKALGELGKVSNVRLSSSIANQLTAIGTAMNGIPDTAITKMNTLADGLQGIANLGKPHLTSFINQLGKLPALVQELDTVDLGKFTQQMKDLADAMKPFADEMQKVSNGFSAFPSRIQRLITSTQQYNGVVHNATRRTGLFGLAMNSLKFAGITFSIHRLSSMLADAITKSNEYQETLNLFRVSMGAYYDEALAYAQEVSDKLYIDPADWMRNQGTFNLLLTGFGNAADRAALMSKNLTQLGYDISSLENISVADSMQKLQSGISGELEPLRRLGYDLSQARLEAVALSLGIDKTVSSMTQAEKAELRYYAIMTQVTESHGDLARTLDSPANQLRILQSQFNMLAREIGNIFIPVLNKVLPVVTAIVKGIRQIAEAIASLMGFTLTDVDYSGLEGAGVSSGELADNMDNAAGAAKKLKQYTAGFDELNIFSPDSGAGAGADAGLGGGFSFGLPEYNFLKDADGSQVDDIMEKIQPALDWIKDHLLLIKDVVEAIGFGFLAWKIGNSVWGFISNLTDLASKGVIKSAADGFKTMAGWVMTAAGSFLYFQGAIDAWQNGVDWDNLIEMVGGLALAAGGLGLALGPTAAAVGLLVGGIGMLVVGVKDWITQGQLSTQTFWLLEGAILAVSAGLGLLIGWPALLVAAIAGGALAIYKYWDELKAFLADCWAKVQSFFNDVGQWLKTSVIEPIAGKFEALGQKIGIAFTVAVSAVKTAWSNVSNWFTDNIIVPVRTAFGEATANIFSFFSTLWDDIVGVFSGAGAWFQTNVVDVISTGFKNLVNGAISVFEGMLNGIISAVNWVISGVNSILEEFGDFSLNYINEISIPRLAEGGYVDEGQLFIAREAGAEMVGAIGRNTAVANNQQIVEGISSGVATANAEQNALLREQNELLRAILRKDTTVNISNRDVKRAYDAANLEAGVGIMVGGVR